MPYIIHLCKLLLRNTNNYKYMTGVCLYYNMSAFHQRENNQHKPTTDLNFSNHMLATISNFLR